MIIAANSVVVFHYTLTNEAGEVLDTSREGEPLPYLHGANNIVQGLEQAMAGKAAGDTFKVSVPPNLGYGPYMDEMVQQVSREMFSGIETLEVGMQFNAEGQSGQQHVVTITAIDGDQITVDGNHDLAGEVLNFDVEIIEVRAASEEEIAHGHVH
ncbi:MAG TPA: peptidylprolyl isomerase [Oceanospirillaceae bacterium]|nr:peptidylprolyl isomerase [Oceanospirillaceae bacterium]